MFAAKETLEIAKLRSKLDSCSCDQYLPQIHLSELISSANCLSDLFKVLFMRFVALRMKDATLSASLVKLQEENLQCGLKKSPHQHEFKTDKGWF